MTLAGQWIADYDGTNKGTVVIDVEDRGDRYHGVACAWDADTNKPSSLVRFVTESKDNAQVLKQIKVVAIVPGKILTEQDLKPAIDSGRLIFPEDVEIKLELQSPNLVASWKTSIGTGGATTAVLSPTAGGQPSDLKPIASVQNWGDFKSYVSNAPPNRYVYRGQSRAAWRLRTTYHRSKRCILERFLLDDVKSLERMFSGLTAYRYNVNDPHDYAAFLSLAQHHGYPTPLLDWTWSPYVAAFFAYRGLGDMSKIKPPDKIRILQFPAYHWNIQIPQANGLFPFPPHVSLMEPLAIGNARAIPQQAMAMVTNIDDIETYLTKFDARLGMPSLQAIDLPASERPNVMRDLALMGITAASLFPGLDGACEALREKNFS